MILVMVARRLLVGTLLVGCNQIYGLDPTKTREEVIDTNDEDFDGVDNSQDNCPGLSNSNQADTDGDRVGDVCDPHRDTPTDKIAAKHFFNFPTFDPEDFDTNGWTFGDGYIEQLHPKGENLIFLKAVPDGDFLVIEAGVVILDFFTSNNEIGLQVEGIGGHRGFVRDIDATDAAAELLIRPASNTAVVSAQASVPTMIPMTMRMGYVRGGTNLISYQLGATIIETRDGALPGAAGVYTIDATARVNYLVVYTGQFP